MNSGQVAKDGTLWVCGSFGYECWISPDGDLYMTLDPLFHRTDAIVLENILNDCPWLIDRRQSTENPNCFPRTRSAPLARSQIRNTPEMPVGGNSDPLMAKAFPSGENCAQSG
jgi:hypothetical protein